MIRRLVCLLAERRGDQGAGPAHGGDADEAAEEHQEGEEKRDCQVAENVSQGPAYITARECQPARCQECGHAHTKS
jgi:hypothetical protein